MSSAFLEKLNFRCLHQDCSSDQKSLFLLLPRVQNTVVRAHSMTAICQAVSYLNPYILPPLFCLWRDWSSEQLNNLIIKVTHDLRARGVEQVQLRGSWFLNHNSYFQTLFRGFPRSCHRAGAQWSGVPQFPHTLAKIATHMPFFVYWEFHELKIHLKRNTLCYVVLLLSWTF